jgi:protein MpaA
MTLPRDYSAITDRIAALGNRADTEVSVIGSVEGLPVHRLVRRSSSTVTRRLLLTSGVHGDEPAGIEAVLKFLETAPTPDGFEFVVVPCVNPTGHVRGTRENSGGVDINRSFEADDAEEVIIIKGLLGGQRFDCHVDFHEDWEATGFYMYETCAGGGGVGSTIIERVEAIMPIDPEGEESDDSKPVSRGVLCVNPSWGRQGLLTYVLAFHTSHAVMFETPSATPMEMRVAAHTIAFNTTLDYLS